MENPKTGGSEDYGNGYAMEDKTGFSGKVDGTSDEQDLPVYGHELCFTTIIYLKLTKG